MAKTIEVREGTQNDLRVFFNSTYAILRYPIRHHEALGVSVVAVTAASSTLSGKITHIHEHYRADKAPALITKAVDEALGGPFHDAHKALVAAAADNADYNAKRGIPAVTDAAGAALDLERRNRFAELSEVAQMTTVQTGDIALRAAILRDGVPRAYKFSEEIARRFREEMRVEAHRAFIAKNYSSTAKPTLAQLIPTGPDNALIDDLLERAEAQRSERIDDVVAAETFLRGIVAVAAAATDRKPEAVFDAWMGNGNA